MAENFAQQTVIALYDKVVPGGIASVQPQWRTFAHQYQWIQNVAGNQNNWLYPNSGKCTRRLDDSKPIKIRTRPPPPPMEPGKGVFVTSTLPQPAQTMDAKSVPNDCEFPQELAA